MNENELKSMMDGLRGEIVRLNLELNLISSWMEERKRQAIAYPIDDVSLYAISERLRTVVENGKGSTALTDTIALTGNAQNISVPKAYTDTILLISAGVTYEVPYVN
jgi:hypothetical protein